MIDESMLICAVRYCLGRSTYVVGEADGWVRTAWPCLSAATRRTLIRDVSDHLERDQGMTCDRATWRDLLSWMTDDR